eukprot:Sspe_Gene.71994::Locus_42812_Transcript_1_1_Confidence_1.000_Length_1933::g.71994::m.71994
MIAPPPDLCHHVRPPTIHVPTSIPPPLSADDIDSVVGELYAALNSVQRGWGTGRPEVDALQSAVMSAAECIDNLRQASVRQPGLVAARVLPARAKETRDARAALRSAVEGDLPSSGRLEHLAASKAVQTKIRCAPPPPPLIAKEGNGNSRSAASVRCKGRTRLNARHPILVKLRCGGCRTPMTRGRWEGLPAKVKRAIAWAQEEVDSYVAGRQEVIQDAITNECDVCRRAETAETIK